MEAAFEKLFTLADFWDMVTDSVDTLIVWWDNGPAQARTFEFNAYMMALAQRGHPFKKVEWNFFKPGHGKSITDTHFSQITRRINDHVIIYSSKITTTQELVDGINSSMNTRIIRGSKITYPEPTLAVDLLLEYDPMKEEVKVDSFLRHYHFEATANGQLRYCKLFGDKDMHTISPTITLAKRKATLKLATAPDTENEILDNGVNADRGESKDAKLSLEQKLRILQTEIIALKEKSLFGVLDHLFSIERTTIGIEDGAPDEFSLLDGPIKQCNAVADYLQMHPV